MSSPPGLFGLLPPLLLALYACWCGSFPGGATFSGSAGGAAALLAALAAAGPGWRDPLRLGRGWFLPLGLWVVVAASSWTSPVERAGRVGVVLLPAFLWLPAAVERCWRDPRRLRWGLRATSAAGALVAGWALLDLAGAFGTALERAAMPLGHHTLLAAWLAMLLPVALVPAREETPWRWLAAAAGLLAASALLATRSAAGLLALATELLLAWAWRRELLGPGPAGLSSTEPAGLLPRGPAGSHALGPAGSHAPGPAGPGSPGAGTPPPRLVEPLPAAPAAPAGPNSPRAGTPPLRLTESLPATPAGPSVRPGRPRLPRWAWVAGALVLIAAGSLLVHRVRQGVAGGDLSLRVRGAYWLAGWRGLRSRPALGWGPGSAAWTAARFLAPVPTPQPGANPVGETVGELHALVPEIAYELGFGGLLAAGALVAAFTRRRLSELPGAADRPLLAASLLALAGGAVAGLGTGALRVTALPLLAAIIAGAALAAAGPAEPGAERGGGAGAGWEPGAESGGNVSAGRSKPGGEGAGGAVASGDGAAARRTERARSPVGAALPSRIYAMVAALLLARPEAALWHYDRAVAAAVAGAGAEARREGGTGEARGGRSTSGEARAGGAYGEAHGGGGGATAESARAELVRRELGRAVALDPRFPLYRWRLALLVAAAPQGQQAPAPAAGSGPAGEEPAEVAAQEATRRLREAAALAREAARDAAEVAPLWLTAGVLGRQAGASWAVPALAESCRLDPLDPFSPFYLLAAEPGSPEAPVRGALALLDDPRLVAATFWQGRERLLASCLEMVRAWTGVDPGWKEALLAAVEQAAVGQPAVPQPPLAVGQPAVQQSGVPAVGQPAVQPSGVPAVGQPAVGQASARQPALGDAAGPGEEPPLRLALAWDGSPALALSLHAFRRRPWPGSWPLVAVRAAALARLQLPPATSLGYVFLGVPPRPVCGLGTPRSRTR